MNQVATLNPPFAQPTAEPKCLTCHRVQWIPVVIMVLLLAIFFVMGALMTYNMFPQIIEKSVQVFVPIDRIVEVETIVKVPEVFVKYVNHYIPVPVAGASKIIYVDKIIDRPVYIDRIVEKIVEKPIYIDRPVYIEVEVPARSSFSLPPGIAKKFWK